MSISLKDVSTVMTKRAPHIVIYSIGGVGKTTLGATAAVKEKGLMILTGEDGLSLLPLKEPPSHIKIGCNKEKDNLEGGWETWKDYQNIIKQLVSETHPYKLIVQDPLSSLSNALESYVVKERYDSDYDKANAYGSKYQDYQTEFNRIIEAYKIMLNKGITILTLCHGHIIDYKDPSSEPYKKWDIALPAGTRVNLATQLFNHADAVLFGCYDVTVKDGRGVGNRRVLKADNNPAYSAKSRVGFPDKLLFDWGMIKQTLEKIK